MKHIPLLIRAYYKMRRLKFQSKCGSMPKTSGIGALGFGDSCILAGIDQLFCGENTWINRQAELLVYGKKARLSIGGAFLQWND